MNDRKPLSPTKAIKSILYHSLRIDLPRSVMESPSGQHINAIVRLAMRCTEDMKNRKAQQS